MDYYPWVTSLIRRAQVVLIENIVPFYFAPATFKGPNVSLLSLRTLNLGFVLNVETVRFLGPTEFSLGGDSKKDVLQTWYGKKNMQMLYVH